MLLAATAAVRDADWIVVLCLLAGAAVCVCGVVRGRTLAVLTGLGRGAALLRTLVLSGLGLLVFGALFASADALLAEWVDAVLPDLTVDVLVARAFVTVAVGGTVLAGAYLALNPPVVDRDGSPARPVAHRFEWLAPVVVVNAVFAALLIAQATVVFGGHDYLQRTTGLTYAEYVHQGFGQLTVATALTLVVIWAAARKAPLATTADRMWLCGSLGLVVLAVMVAGALLRTDWLPRFALISGVVALLGLAALNPDAWIAEHNLDRYADTGRIDWTYLRGLSDDAVPVLDGVDPAVRECALGGREPADDDWLEWNLGRARAADALGQPVPVTADQTTRCPGS